MIGWSGRLFAATLVFGALFAAGCSAGDDAPPPSEVVQQEETTSSALADGKIVVASNVAYPPFEFSPRKGPKGFDIDLMNEVAERMDLEVRYRNVQFDSLLRGLSSDLFDAAISGMTITETRRQQVDFSEPYYNVDEALVVRSGSEIESTDDLAEEVIGVQGGTIGQAEARDLLNAGDVEEVRPYRTIGKAFDALENEAVDGVVYDLPAAQSEADESGGRLELVEVIATGEQYGIALPKESPLAEPVNEALAEIKEDGTYEEIYERWIGRPPEEIP
ncbi:MAG: basic amino acid ABC transporter substrate-binding protein [Rubrobacter sp.]